VTWTKTQKKNIACLNKRYIRKDRVDKAVKAEVRLLKQKSSAYKVKKEIAQKARL
jgi:hypothetical protein